MRKIIFFVATALLFANCNKASDSGSEPQPQGRYFAKGEKLTLKSDIDATKISSQSDGSFRWQEGDQIKVTVGGSSTYATVKSITEGGAKAEFEIEMPAAGDKYDVQFPADEASLDLSTQVYKANCLPDGKMLFKAVNCVVPESGPATFKLAPQYSGLQLNFYGNQTISKIVVKNVSTLATYTLNVNPAVALPANKANAIPFFFVLPVGNYIFSAEMFDNAAIPASLCKFAPSSAQPFVAGNIRNMTEPQKVEIPLFSVGPTTKVRFSKGNLHYTIATNTWDFYDRQYDYPSTYESDVVSLFTWGYDPVYSVIPDGKQGITTHTESDENFDYSEDWGSVISPSGKWRTLTIDEWKYLLDTRGSGNYYFRIKVNVCGKPNCLVIAPDGNSTEIAASYDAAAWDIAETAGFVCLPAAGDRDGNKVDKIDVGGGYWSSTSCTVHSGERAYNLYFNNEGIDIVSNDLRGKGTSVRLISVVVP